jgi:hypothetical protein
MNKKATALLLLFLPAISAFTCSPAFNDTVFRVPTYAPAAACAQTMTATHARTQYYLPGWDGVSNVVSMGANEVLPGSYDNLGNYWLAVVSDAYYDAQGCSPTSEPTHCVKRDPEAAAWIHIMIRQSYWDSCPSPYSIKSRGAQAVGRAYGLGWSKGNGPSVMHRPPNIDTPSTADKLALQDCTGAAYDLGAGNLCPVP